MKIKPFRAYRYDDSKVGNAGDCVAPPYDVIDDDQRERLYTKNEYNIVRISKSKTFKTDTERDNQYTRAAGFLNDWLTKGILKQDSDECIYAYVQDFRITGKNYQRYSFIARAKLEDFGRVVRPHEQILNKPKIDRYNLQKATQAVFGLVFMLYDDPTNTFEKIAEHKISGKPLVDMIDEQKVRHRIYSVNETDDIEQITKMMRDKSCVIADGHHRYTTHLLFAEESGNPAHKYQMMAFCNTCHEGLLVLATHRLVKNIAGFNCQALLGSLASEFEIEQFGFSAEHEKATSRAAMLKKMKAEYERDKNAFGIYCGSGKFCVVSLKNKNSMDSVSPDKSKAWRGLDVAVLHKLILEKYLKIDEEKLSGGDFVEYVKDTPEAMDRSIEQVDNGQIQAAFFMNPPKIEQINAVAEAGERMPQKSTYFFPKVFTGLTIDKL